MPPRTYRDLTDEELEELLQDELVASAPVAPLPTSARAAAPAYRMEIGDIQMRGPGSDEAWLDELIASPPQTPQRPMLSAAGAGGTFAGEDTPQARALIQQRGMHVTEQPPPSDDELLEGLASERPATMPDLGEQDAWLDELIGQQGAAMDREQAAASAPAAAPRRSREAQLAELFAPPTRAQGFAAILGDALFGGNNVAALNARGAQRQNALAQARMQDVAAGERSEERAADRQMMDERLRLTMRGQDLASARGQENLDLRRQLAGQTDARLRELETQREGAAMDRTKVRAAALAAGEAPPVSAEDAQAGTASFLAAQANVPKAKAKAFLAGQTDDLTPEEIERLEVNHDQWKIMSPKKRQEVLAGGMRREGSTPDQIEADRKKQQQNVKQRADLKESVDEIGRTIAAAKSAWKRMSPNAQKAFASLASGGFAGTIKQGLLTPDEQKSAAAVQALANGLVKNLGGSAVSATEWGRIAGSIGFPVNDYSPFNSPEGISDWIERTERGLMGRVKAVESEYGDLWGDDAAP